MGRLEGESSRLAYLEDRVEEMDRSAREADRRLDAMEKLMGGLEGVDEHARARRELAKAEKRVKATEPAGVQYVTGGIPLPWPRPGTLLARLARARRLGRDTEVGDPDRTMVITLLDWMEAQKLLTVSQERLKEELEPNTAPNRI